MGRVGKNSGGKMETTIFKHQLRKLKKKDVNSQPSNQNETSIKLKHAIFLTQQKITLSDIFIFLLTNHLGKR